MWEFSFFEFELNEEKRIYRLVDWTGKSHRWALIMRSTKEIGTHVQMCIYVWNARTHARSLDSICGCVCVRDEIAEQLTYFHEFHYAVHCTTKNDECILKWNDSHFCNRDWKKSECNWQMKKLLQCMKKTVGISDMSVANCSIRYEI